MILQKTKRILLSLLAAFFLVSALNAQTKLLRFPDVHGDKVVFTYGGDLWLASTSGGLASRLTAHLNETRHVIQKGGKVGKRLDFMMQELNREANTLGSKAAAKELADSSMTLKLLIEQMREQVQNLE